MTNSILNMWEQRESIQLIKVIYVIKISYKNNAMSLEFLQCGITV